MQKDSDLTELVMNNVLGQWVLYTPRAYYVLSPTERSQRLWLSQLTKTTQLKFLWWLFEEKKRPASWITVTTTIFANRFYLKEWQRNKQRGSEWENGSITRSRSFPRHGAVPCAVGIERHCAKQTDLKLFMGCNIGKLLDLWDSLSMKKLATYRK